MHVPAGEIPPLLDYITKISPDFRPPYHLLEYLAIYERVRQGEPVRVLCTLPIRHFKTETTLHALLWLLEHDPTLRIVLMTHSHERAVWLGKRMRALAKRTGVGPARGYDTINEWMNDFGGGVLIMSADMSREGWDCHVLVVDDPIDEKSITAKDKRQAVDDGINYYTARCQKAGKRGPVIIVASRLDDDDPIGRRLVRKAVTWETHHAPAVLNFGTDHEQAFAPDVISLEELRQIRAELAESDPREKTWFARFMGTPRADEHDGFRDPLRYQTLPTWPGFRDVLGIDLSFSAKKRADFAAIVRVRVYPHLAFVVDVQRFKAEPRELVTRLKLARTNDEAIFSYMSGPEKGFAEYLAGEGLEINAMQVTAPKFVRAQNCIAAHNAGKILWPEHAPWVNGTLRNLTRWAGNEDDEDDEADAYVSVYEGAIRFAASQAPRKVGSWRF